MSKVFKPHKPNSYGRLHFDVAGFGYTSGIMKVLPKTLKMHKAYTFYALVSEKSQEYGLRLCQSES